MIQHEKRRRLQRIVMMERGATGLLLIVALLAGCSRRAAPPVTSASPVENNVQITEEPATEEPAPIAQIPGAAVNGVGAKKNANSKNNRKTPAAEVKKPDKAGKIQWAASFEDAMKKARAENRPMMLNFHADWCAPCKYLEAEVFPDQGVVAESKNFVNVSIDGEKRLDVMQAFGVTAFPTIIWFDPKDEVILHRLEGIAKQDAAKFFIGQMQTARAKYSPAVAL